MRRPPCFISTGSVLIDLPLHVGRVPAPGGAVTATSSGPTVGGGYTVVSAVARQGVPAALAATLGTGPNSAQVRETMMSDGVELVVEELVGDIGTCTTLIEPSGRRTFVTTEGVEAEAQREDLDRLELIPGDWVYTTGYDLAHRTSRNVLAEWLLALPVGVSLVADLGPVESEIPGSIIDPLLRRTNLLTGNHLEITQLSARLGSQAAMREAAPDALIVRRTGVHGCILWPAHGDMIGVPAIRTPVSWSPALWMGSTSSPLRAVPTPPRPRPSAVWARPARRGAMRSMRCWLSSPSPMPRFSRILPE